MAILQSGYRDASGTNASSRSVRLYKDLALSFEKNANTKDVLQKKDVDAVKQSVRNLILTNHYERPFHPEIIWCSNFCLRLDNHSKCFDKNDMK